LWFSASLKFFIPFSLLMRLGSSIQWRREMASPTVTLAMEQITQPFSAGVPFVPSISPFDWTPIVLAAVWACGFAFIALTRFRSWRRIRAAVRAGRRVDITAPVEIRVTPGLLEPGVVRIFRPILLLPEGILERLAPPQMQAVLSHELCHVRRRDNLLSSIHMFVEAMFWFHPLIWWIGTRLVEERERACDEVVLAQGSTPHEYAEGILNVCRLYLESPLACVSGVTGSNLRKRIDAIMTNRQSLSLTLTKKAILTATATLALAAPLLAGLMNAPPIRAQSKVETFEVASVRPNLPDDRRMHIEPRNGGKLTARNVSLEWLIQFAYHIHWNQVSI